MNGGEHLSAAVRDHRLVVMNFYAMMEILIGKEVPRGFVARRAWRGRCFLEYAGGDFWISTPTRRRVKKFAPKTWDEIKDGWFECDERGKDTGLLYYRVPDDVECGYVAWARHPNGWWAKKMSGSWL